MRIDPSDIYDISLTPKNGQGLGISVQGTEHASSDAWVMVTSINPDSVIGRTNKVHIGDQLLAVNESILLGKSHDYAVSSLVNAKNLKSLKLVFVRSKVQHGKYATALQNLNDGPLRVVKIVNKEGKSLGISIVVESGVNNNFWRYFSEMGTNRDICHFNAIFYSTSTLFLPGGEVIDNSDLITGIFISKIADNSLAASSGQFSISDEILEINNESVRGLQHSDFLSLVKTLRGCKEFVIKVKRNIDGFQKLQELLESRPKHQIYKALCKSTHAVLPGHGESPGGVKSRLSFQLGDTLQTLEPIFENMKWLRAKNLKVCCKNQQKIKWLIYGTPPKTS